MDAHKFEQNLNFIGSSVIHLSNDNSILAVVFLMQFL